MVARRFVVTDSTGGKRSVCGIPQLAVNPRADKTDIVRMPLKLRGRRTDELRYAHFAAGRARG